MEVVVGAQRIRAKDDFKELALQRFFTMARTPQVTGTARASTSEPVCAERGM